MDVGTGLLWIALILAAGSSVPSAAHVVSNAGAYRRLARILLALSFTAITGAFALMAYAFLAPDLSIGYVFTHTHVDYPWHYRVAGVWSGDVGSILLWSWLLSLITLAFSLGGAKDSPTAARIRAMTSVVLSVILAALLYVLIVADPFRPTPPMNLITEGTSAGLGLSPLLLTPLVIVHPPLEFLAYALITVPFAASFSYLLLGRGDWAVVAMTWTRASWLLLTLAILLGALWAYSVLGWGGYWAWDPVETANLVVWIPLTALVHAQLWGRRKGQFPHVSILLAALAFSLMLFATFETRTGIIQSVHSFTPVSGVTDPSLGSRLVSVLGAGGAVSSIFVIMLVSLLATACAFLFYFLRLRRVQSATSTLGALVPIAFLGTFLVAIAWVLVDSAGAVRATLDVVDAVGLGRSSLGLLVLAGVFVGIPLLWVLLTAQDPEGDPEGVERWISDDGTMTLALALFLLWGLVTLGLMILGANALDASAFEERLPFLIVPLGAVLVAALSWRWLGRRHVPYALIVLGFAVVLSYVLFASNLGAAYFPLAFAVILASAYRIARSWAPAVMPRELRLAAVLALASLLFAFVMWSSGVQEMRLGAFHLTSSLALSVLGTIASLAGIAILAVGVGHRDRRLWLASGLLGLVLLGFAIGSILAVASVVLVLRSSESFAPRAAPRTLSPISILRGSSPHLIHLGVALVLLGYATSAHFATEVQVTATPTFVTDSFSGYQFRLVHSSGVDRDGDGRYERITAEISVAKGGVPQFVAPLQVVWRGNRPETARYFPEPFTRSLPTGDLSLTFVGFSDGRRWYSVGDDAPSKASSDALTQAVFLVKESPLIVPLWGGGWLMAAGMGVRMWSERGLVFRERVAHWGGGRPDTRSSDITGGIEEHYVETLAREVREGRE